MSDAGLPLSPLRPDRCPFCGEEVDFATVVALSRGTVREPRANDFTLCARCGEWVVFDDERRMRKPTPTEYLEVVKPEYQFLRQAWAERRSSEQAAQEGCEADQQ